jgi:hypothetical protein
MHFEAGLERTFMKALVLGVTLFAMCATALAQIDTTRPILLTGPDAQGSTMQEAQEVVQLAAQHGYNGVSLGIGTERLSDPNNIDLSGVQTITRAAMQAGLKYICWRLDVDVPNNQAWADAFNGGVIWPVATRPPSGAWSKIASIWQQARDISAAEMTADGVNPAKGLLFVMVDEPGIGGVGGPSLGPWSISGFYYNLFQATGDPTWFLVAFPSELLGSREGYIEPDFWTMLRGIRSLVTFGAKTYCVSFEGSETSLPNQVASVTGPDAEWVYANTYGYAINVFGLNTRKTFDSISFTFTRANLTPIQGASAWKTRMDKLLAMVRVNPILANERVVLTEFNLSTARMPDLADYFPYREELLKQAMAYPNLDAAMIFAAYATDPTTASMQLFNRVVTNGVVSITPVGSNAVGPAYLNLVP